MQTKLGRICDAIIEAGWLAALIVTPLFFNTSSNRVFEPDKLHLLRSIALVMAVAWIAQLLDSGLRGLAHGDGVSGRGRVWAAIRGTPLVLPTLVLVGAYLLSTALSVAPRISFFGSYVRLQGTYTFISYVLIFFMVLTHLRSRVQLNRIFYAVILTSLPIAIYAIIQHFNRDPLPWGGDTQERVAANMGNAIFVAAYLIIALFLTVERLVDSIAALLNEQKGTTADALRAGAYLFVLTVQGIAIVFSQSRGPLLGWAAGAYIFAMLGLLLMVRWATRRATAPAVLAWLTRYVRGVWLSLIGLTIAAIVVLALMNVPQGPLKNVCQKRYIGRLCTLTSLTDGTNAVRVLIWEGVVDMMLKPHAPIQTPDGVPDTWNIIRPLVGYGPESMWVAYNRFYPPDLAHYEARNASPDRSHNETFDTLVRTGLVGFGVQLWLYGSVFYYALRWLGLMSGHRQRNLFWGFLAGGALLGVIVPLIADHSLRLAGIGLPAGLIIGLSIYVTVDLVFVRAPGDASTTAADPIAGGGRRQLLILTLFAAIIAHFFEIHLGIAIASTLTTFWVLAAVLIAAGMGWVNPTAEVADEAQSVQNEDVAHRAVMAAPAASGKLHGEVHPATAASRRKASTPAALQAARPAASASARRSPQRPAPLAAQRPHGELPALPKARSPILTFLPYAGIVSVISLVLTWNFLVNQTGAQDPLVILWNAFTVRVDGSTFRAVQSPMLLVMLLFTWVVGGMLAIAEHTYLFSVRGRTAWLANAAIYAGTAAGVWLIYGMIQANRLLLTNLSGLAVFRHIANHIDVFVAFLFGMMLAVAAALWISDTRPRPSRFSQVSPVIPLLGGAGAAILALLVIVDVNIQTVQADTYYKQGLAYENAGAWEGAAILHNEAAKLEPQEDYYYLFLGRALLQMAGDQPVGNVVLPAATDLEKLDPQRLLTAIDRGMRARDREDMMRASFAALIGAQHLNPYNTDHTANLARHSRSWAFTNALGPNDTLTNSSLYQIVATRPKDVDMGRLKQSIEYYREATALSPQNAQLWNEMATTQFIMGDIDGAKASLDRSRNIDPIFSQTYILRGDMLATIGDKTGALEAYRKGAELAGNDPGVLSAVGVYSAQTGDAEGALAAFQRLAETQQTSLEATQQQLADLNALVDRLGGYSTVLSSASQRRDALQASIASQRSQLHLTLRNQALVLRDTGRLPEALEAARAALTYATDAERPTTDALITELQSQQK